jgi:hypothetical protein
MADIFDLVPPAEFVEIGETRTEVRAIDLSQALQIMARFPSLTALLAGGKKTIGLNDLLASGAVPAIIAAGLVHRREGDEADLARLDADTQAMMLIPILRLTMPRGVVPFLTRVTEFVTVLSPSPAPTREDIANELVRRSSRKPSPSSSSNTEVPLAAMPS